jgi:hypothetical protein
MSAAAFTPGPWHSLDIGEIVPSDADGYPCDDLRICFMATAGSDPAAPDRIEANARLIGAAPDLYVALVEAKKEMWLSARHQWTREDFNNWAIIQQINAALTKADGKPGRVA